MTRFLLLLLALLALPSITDAGLPRGHGCPPALCPPGNWYNPSWGYRKQITIAHGNITSGDSYTNFPVLISISGDADLAANAQSNGQDILFTDSTGTNALNYERESYSSGTLVAWVQEAAGLSSSVDTQGYMYYGNPTASDQQNVTASWDTHYKAVYHLASSNTQLNLPRYSGNPVLNYGTTGTWDYSQLYDPNIMVDPSNSNQLIMFYSGMSSPVETGHECIGRATAPTSSPTTWTPYASNPIICPTDNHRVDSVIYKGGTFYLYSTDDTAQNIDLYTSTDGFTFTASASNPILTPTGNGCSDGTFVSQGAVYYDGVSTWTMLYAYRNGSTILPGYRVATSSDGVTWTKSGCTDVISHGPPGAWDSTYMEFHNLQLIGSTFVLTYEAFNGTEYWIGMATTPQASFPGGPWTKSGMNPIFEASQVASAFDQYHVATPAWFEVGSTWYLMYQGGNVFSPYGTSRWAFGMATLAAGQTPLTAMTTGITDSTGNNNLGGTAMSAITGQMDGAFTVDGATGHASSNTAATPVTSGYTVEAWMVPASLSQGNNSSLVVLNGLNAGTGGTGYGMGQGDGAGGAGSHLVGLNSSKAWIDSGYVFSSTTNWVSAAMINTAGTTSFIVNGSAQSGTSASTPTAPANGFSIGTQGGTPEFAGSIDEVRISNIARSAAWLTTEYTMESAPSSFYTIGPQVPY